MVSLLHRATIMTDSMPQHKDAMTKHQRK